MRADLDSKMTQKFGAEVTWKNSGDISQKRAELNIDISLDAL